MNKAKKNNERLSVIRIIGFTLLILIFVAAVAYVLATTKTDNLTEAENDSDIFYSSTADNIKDMCKYNDSGLAVLTDTSVRYFDSFGNEIANNEYTYSNPVIETNGKNLILYESGSHGLRLEKAGTVFSELNFDSVITVATVGKKGNYAYVLNDDGGYQSHIFVYSFRGEKQFECGINPDYVTAVSLADNGKYLCAASVSADNGQIYSDVYLYKFSSDEPVYKIELQGIAVYSVQFTAGKNVAAYTDKGVYLFNSNGEYKEMLTYSSSEMLFSDDYSGITGATVINKYGNTSNPVLTAFCNKYKSCYSVEFDEAVNYLSVNDDYIAVCFSDRVEIYNSEGSLVSTIAIDETYVRCEICNRKLFVLYSNGIKYHTMSSGKSN